jgi:hypothetical protein
MAINKQTNKIALNITAKLRTEQSGGGEKEYGFCGEPVPALDNF